MTRQRVPGWRRLPRLPFAIHAHFYSAVNTIDICGWKGQASLLAQEPAGITGSAQMDPFHLAGILDITGKGTGVSRVEPAPPQDHS